MSHWPASTKETDQVTHPAHLTLDELAKGVDSLPASPTDSGIVEMIVVRPDDNVWATPETIELSRGSGVADDHWSRGRYAHKPEMQLSLMNAHVLGLIAGTRTRWPLAGDNLVVDLDLSRKSLRAGTHLAIGTAVIEISEKAHRGCAKFSARFGEAAREFVNHGDGPEQRLRGVYATVVEEGIVSLDDVTKRM